MTMEPVTDKDFNVWSLIVQTRDIIFKARDDELSKYGITAVEVRVLFLIKQIGEKTTPAMLSRGMLREHNTVTALLTRMQNKGLITKNKDPEKKNTWRIGLTEKGEEAYNNSTKRESLHEIFTTLSDVEKEQLMTYLRKLSDQAFKYTAIVPSLPLI
jgi:DNA-binding MarR family transcriptional regulator